MKIEDIHSEWAKDCDIDLTNLTKSLHNLMHLHSKYTQIHTAEKTKLRVWHAKYKKLKHEKYEFLINPTEEGFERGWEIPVQGKLLKNEVNIYLEGDSELIDFELKIGLQEEKISLLKSIIENIKTKNFIIRAIIEDRKFMSGS